MTTMAPPETAAESLDPRDPLLRLSTFFDDGTVELLHERDKSGVLAASGAVNGGEDRRVLHRRHRHGWCDGHRGLRPYRQCLRPRH